MPPKRKDFLNPKAKSKRKQPQDPQTENEFLEVADEFEQAAGKWRAGDAAKAARFFNRAIEVYDEGLKRFPGSFDLAYNKANLEYNMCEDDRIVAQLGNKISLLEETLNSHRVAISLDPENTDVVFNTAQVLTALSEALLETETQETAKAPSRTLLEEAVELFTKCLAKQQQKYEEKYVQTAAAFAVDDFEQQEDTARRAETEALGQTPPHEEMETSSTTSSAPGEWATVEEPLTPETILETSAAQLGALTTLLGLYDPADLSTVEPRAQIGMDTVTTIIPKLITLLAKSASPFPKPVEAPRAGPILSISSSPPSECLETTPKDDALLAAANFEASLNEIAYRSGRKTAAQYASEVESKYSTLTQPPQTPDQQPAYLNALSAYADALMDLASAIADTSYTPTSPTFASDLETQWTALTTAQTILTQLSSQTSILPASRLADTFLARGDTDLFRFRISLLEQAKPAWAKSKAVLVANAGVFYRGARTYAEKAEKEEVRRTADAKTVVAEVLRKVLDGSGVVEGVDEARVGEVVRVLEQMVEEGILGRSEAEGVLGLLK